MVIQLVKHMGAAGVYTKSTVQFNKLLDEEQTWEKAKGWYCASADKHSEMKK